MSVWYLKNAFEIKFTSLKKPSNWEPFTSEPWVGVINPLILPGAVIAKDSMFV